MPVTSWNGPQYKANVQARVQRNLDRAAIFLVGEVKKSFGSPPKMTDSFKKEYSRKQRATAKRAKAKAAKKK